MSTIHRAHDPTYKELFSHKLIIRQLVEQLLPPEVSQALALKLNWEGASLEQTEWFTEDLERREADLLWRIPWARVAQEEGEQEGAEDALYVFFLLEFQSSVDYDMALRLLQYVTMFYMRLIKQDIKHRRRLPLVLPIVLYNGERNWHVPRSVEEHIALDVSSSLYNFIPRMCYILLDIQRLERVHLEELRSVLSMLLLLEHKNDQAQFEHILNTLKPLLNIDELSSLRANVIDWLNHATQLNQIAIPRRQLQDFMEDKKNMLADNFRRWREEALEQGLKDGLEKGREKGEHEALRRTLLRQLELKFGPNTARLERVQALSMEALDEALALLLNAQTEQSIFDVIDAR